MPIVSQKSVHAKPQQLPPNLAEIALNHTSVFMIHVTERKSRKKWHNLLPNILFWVRISGMYLINRSVAVVKIKQPFLDWINSTDRHSKLTLEIVNRESHIYLLPEHDTEQELEVIIQDLYKEIFELELAGFSKDKNC